MSSGPLQGEPGSARELGIAIHNEIIQMMAENIKTIQSETRGAVSAMQEGVGEVEKGTAASHESGKALDSTGKDLS